MKRLHGLLCLGSWLLTGLLVAETYDDECADLIGSCAYYECIDQERLSCGEDGYALGYGKKYCERFSAMDFKDNPPPFSGDLYPAKGNEWRDNVRSCLQESMEAWFASDEEKDCSALRAFAFDSHPACYTERPSFCELTPENVIRVGLTIQLNDLFKAESQKQIRETSRLCVTQLDERIDAESRPWMRFKLAEYKKIWILGSGDPALFLSLFHHAK
jgi:hypothetical protein